MGLWEEEKLEKLLIKVLKDVEENQEEQTKAILNNTQAIKDLISALKPKVSNLSLTLGNLNKIGELKMANVQVGSNQKVPYVVNHVDGSPLKAGNTIRVSSSDPNGASIVPDPQALAGLGTGFVVGGVNLQVGLKITADELDANGVVVDTTSVLIDVIAAVVGNLSLTLGSPVTAARVLSFANPFGR